MSKKATKKVEAPEFEDPDLIFSGSANYPALDEILPKVLGKMKMPSAMTGATGRGWSRYKTLQACPYLYAVRYRGLLDVPASEGDEPEVCAPPKSRRPAAEIGILVHAMLAAYYGRGMSKVQAMRLLGLCVKLDADPEITDEAARLFNAYTDNYPSDYLRPLAVEWEGVDSEDNTCRFDLVAAVDEDQPALARGLYVVEHKTTSRFDRSMMESWVNDGEVLGQINAGTTTDEFERKFGGPLAGVIVNIIGRQKVPKFVRIVVPVEDRHVQHMVDLRYWRAVEAMCDATGVWPRARNSCTTKYGLCDLFGHCAVDGQAQ